VKDRSGAEEADTGNDLSGDPTRVAVWSAVGGVADLGNVNESCVKSAAPTQMRMFVRKPAGLPAISRSRPIAPPSTVARRSLASTLRRNASIAALRLVD
jgi:hypothetical protein